ncbi:hypothetical protein G6F43_009386 [Rhizopus delemar]|nr:hypothetical protein G6F43_009386 [Rhizopus delemar]
MFNSIHNLFSKTNVDPEKEQFKITLNVYDILQPGFLTNVGYVLGIGVYHTGVEIGKKEYCFGGHNYENHTGVFVVQPKIGPHDVPYKQSIHMGYSKLSQKEIEKVISELSDEYMGTSYNLLTRNCNHFSDNLCKRLTGKSIPGWINRAAKLGAMFPCVIPTEWVDPPDAQAVVATSSSVEPHPAKAETIVAYKKIQSEKDSYALDFHLRSPDENDLKISSQTSLIILFKDICQEDTQETFEFSKFLQAQKAYHFFEQSPLK